MSNRYNINHDHHFGLVSQQANTNSNSTAEADGNVISFAGIWSYTKVLDKFKILTWWWH